MEREVGVVAHENGNLNRLESTEMFEVYGVFGMHRLADDSLLIITQELGFYKWYNDSIRKLPDFNSTPLSELAIYGSLLLSDGDLALNSFTNGLVIADVDGNIKRKIDRSFGIRSNLVQYIYQDRDLNLWLALENGISKVNYHSPLSYFNDKTGVEGNVQAIIRFKDNIYIGTSSGLFIKNDGLYGTRRFVNTDVVKDQIWDFEIVENTLFVATANGIYKTNDGKNFIQVNREQTNTIVYRENRKDFIIGGPRGIFVYDNRFNDKWSYTYNFSTFFNGEIDPTNDSIIWLGTTKSGVLRLVEDPEEGFIIDMYGYIDGLLDDLGKPMIYNDSLIFGAKDGLFYFVNEDIMREDLKDQLTAEELADPAFTKGIFEPYVLNDSLFKGQFLLLEKGEDRIWYCNEFKIGYYDHVTKEFKNRPFWGIDYGRINKFYLEEDGVLWIGAAEGLIRYEKNNLKKYESHFYSLIRRVELTKGDTIV